jgi:hypothetical protein
MSKFSPDHMGRKTPDSNPAPALSSSHGFNADQPYRGDTPNIARDAGRGKNVHPIKVHGGMTDRQAKGASLGGMGHPVAGSPDASSANPLDPTAPGKRLTRVTPSPGMRSRTNAAHSGIDLHTLGRCILDEAVRNK